MKTPFRAISVCICLILFLSAAIVIGNRASASGSWTTKAPMPEAREQSASAVFGGLFYVFGGSSSTVPEVYDPLSNSWSTRAPDSTGRCDMAAITYNGKIHVIGGWINCDFNSPTTVHRVYDPVANTWSGAASTVVARGETAYGLIGGKFYLAGGGASFPGAFNQTEIYDPVTDTWSFGAPIPIAVRHPGSAVIDGKLYVVSGQDASHVYRPEVQIYDPVSNSWTYGAPIPTPRHSPLVGVINGKMYAATGYNGSVLTTLEIYDIASNSWTTGPSSTTPRWIGVSAVINSKFYIAEGRTDVSNDTASLEVFTPESIPGPTCTPPPPNMVSWWPGDGNANDIQDGNNGTPQNGATFAPGKVAQAFSFDGVDDFVGVQNSANLNLTQALSIDAWVNPSVANQYGGIVEKTVGDQVNTQYLLHLEGGVVFFRLIIVPGVDHRTVHSNSAIPINAWTHIVGTWDGATMKLFINGVQQTETVAVTPPINSGAGPTLIGRLGQNIYHFAGLIDEVEIFNRALSTPEIVALYTADSAGKCKVTPTPTPTPTPSPSPTACTRVINTSDSGPGSLRKAISCANLNPGPDTISFNIPTSDPGFNLSVFTIRPLSALPTLTDNGTTIDGATQTAFTGNTNAAGPEIVINGGLMGFSAPFGGGLNIPSSGNHINRLVINGFNNTGITITGAGATGNLVTGCFLGTNAAGNAAVPNTFDGIAITQGASNNIVGGTTPSATNVISGNSRFGVLLFGQAQNVPNNVVEGNLIGTDASGQFAVGNLTGVGLIMASSNTIGGTAPGARNVISGNGNLGLNISGSSSTGNQVQGNFIGINATGNAAVPNGGVGVSINSSGNTVGGVSAGARNVISGNAAQGLRLITIGATLNVVQGNYIGTDASGNIAIGNGGNGIVMNAGATANQIGGTTPGAGNVVSGNGASGIYCLAVGTSNNTIQGNFCGTNASGTAAIANQVDGVRFDSGASDNLVGGTAPGARNIISGNLSHGVHIDDFPVANGGPHLGTARNTVQGNLIGTDVTGTQPIGNRQPGVVIFGGASDNLIGGTNPGAGNVIAFTTGATLDDGQGGLITLPGPGISVANDARTAGDSAGGNSLRNRISQNSIFSNNGPGIDLSNIANGADPTQGPTANDSCDTDSGPNNFQNTPVITSVCQTGNLATIQGTLNSEPGTTFSIEFYANASCDPSGFGEGQTYLGSIQVTTDVNCTANFTFLSLTPNGQSVITATATDPNGNTSEFSSCATTQDSDADGTQDCQDTCPNDPNKVNPGVCGCGVPDTDSDRDGTPDCIDTCPNDPNKVNPGACGCGVPDTDADGDGTPDCIDTCPNDPNKIARGVCGCGVADTDSDGDGVANCIDNCPNTPNPGQADWDQDGIGDACDPPAVKEQCKNGGWQHFTFPRTFSSQGECIRYFNTGH